MFEHIFNAELQNLGIDNPIIDKLREEIKLNYNTSNRHYHNIDHLNNVIEQLFPLKNEIEDWSTLIFSVAYHDIIYDTTKNDNEEQSAIFAYERLSFLEQPLERKEKCKEQILATKGHQISENMDTNYFTDADLSILGADSHVYLTYASQIRHEYLQYSDSDYRYGRSKVLNYFLNMPAIFKTDQFKNKFEERARMNIRNELDKLNR